MKKKPADQYWSTFGEMFGGYMRVCSTHKSLKAAVRAALKCEHRGGYKHKIFKVNQVSGWRKKS